MQSVNETVMLESFEFRKMYFATFGKMWNESEAPWHGSKKKKSVADYPIWLVVQRHTHAYIWLVVQRHPPTHTFDWLFRDTQIITIIVVHCLSWQSGLNDLVSTAQAGEIVIGEWFMLSFFVINWCDKPVTRYFFKKSGNGTKKGEIDSCLNQCAEMWIYCEQGNYYDTIPSHMHTTFNSLCILEISITYS